MRKVICVISVLSVIGAACGSSKETSTTGMATGHATATAPAAISAPANNTDTKKKTELTNNKPNSRQEIETRYNQ